MSLITINSVINMINESIPDEKLVECVQQGDCEGQDSNKKTTPPLEGFIFLRYQLII